MNTKYKLVILYEDSDIIVCKKPAGIATQTKSSKNPDMESLVKNHLYLANPIKTEPYLAIIHRLDQPVSGILVFGKTPIAARALNKQLQTHGFSKHYKAILTSKPTSQEQTLVNYMKKDSRTNTSSICNKTDNGSKLAKLHYATITTPTASDYELFTHCGTDFTGFPMVDILLDTGRHHQIRVQMAHLNCPIWGDTKYGKPSPDNSSWSNIALCAYKLDLNHPINNNPLSFSI